MIRMSLAWIHQIDKSITQASLGLEVNGQVQEILSMRTPSDIVKPQVAEVALHLPPEVNTKWPKPSTVKKTHKLPLDVKWFNDNLERRYRALLVVTRKLLGTSASLLVTRALLVVINKVPFFLFPRLNRLGVLRRRFRCLWHLSQIT